MSTVRFLLLQLTLALSVGACTKEQSSNANAPDPTMASPESTSGAHPDGSTEGAEADHTGTAPNQEAPGAPANSPTGSGTPAQ